MKNKKLIMKLEQLYQSNINSPRPGSLADYPDVPYVQDDEYKTYYQIPAPNTQSQFDQTAKIEGVEEPEVKTKSGKNVINEPPAKNPEIQDVEIYDKKGNEIDISDEDDKELKEMIFLLTASLLEQDAAKNKAANPTGVDPNIDPNQADPDPNQMMGGDPTQDPKQMMQQDPNQMNAMDPNMGGGGMVTDPSMGMGGFGNEPQKTAEEIGKIFELKKIYSRLLAIESQLSFSSDIILLKLRKFITKAIELFEVLIANINSFREEVDNIIVLFYEFLEEVYGIMKRYYKIKQRENNEQNKKE